MALPPVPDGYDSWNEYIEINAPALATAQGITLQEAKASLKLLDVSMPIRSAVGEPYYREYNVFTTWAERAQVPLQGRPWRPIPAVSIDFANGQYAINGTTKTLSEVVEDNTDYGGTFYADRVIAGVGLRQLGGQSNNLGRLTNAAFAEVGTSFVAVATIDYTYGTPASPSNFSVFLSLYDPGYTNGLDMSVGTYDGANNSFFGDYYTFAPPLYPINGLQKYAWIIDYPSASIAYAGGTPASISLSHPIVQNTDFAISIYTSGVASDWEMVIKKIEFFPVDTYSISDLQGLSE